MSYETMTIKDALEKVSQNDIVLPAIQREFVWSVKQIEKLFDSLMRNYPISTFLFWSLNMATASKFTFYKVIKEYNPLSTHNEVLNLTEIQNNNFFALLDGQQRMTSMYISLMGSYKVKRNNTVEEKFLYLNLLKGADDPELEYDFEFKTIMEAQNRDENHFWFKCSDVLTFGDNFAAPSMYLNANNLLTGDQQRNNFSMGLINSFYLIVNQHKLINYYNERSDNIDKVLQIFIRINSGGKTLSYSDLLLSVATAQWQNGNAREAIHGLVDALNSIGKGFNFNKDLVLKSCLVFLAQGANDHKFKVDNFNNRNMLAIEENWKGISESLCLTVNLLSHFGYNGKNLISDFSIIPIALFIFKNENKDIFHSSWDSNRRSIKAWLGRTLLKGVFGGHADNVYPIISPIIKENKNKSLFPLKEIIDKFRGTNKSIIFNDDDIDSLLNTKYSSEKSHIVLSLLYGHLSDDFIYHQDHIHPKSLFKEAKLRGLGLSEDEIKNMINRVDLLPNIQLLKADINIQKNDSTFKDWLVVFNETEKNSYLENNFIPQQSDVSYELNCFIDFFEKRKELMKAKLKRILQD